MEYTEMLINTLITVVLSGVVAAIVSVIMTHYSQKKLDVHQRTMEIRKELYTNITNQFSLFLDTVSDEESRNAIDSLLKYYREIQIWGSDGVVTSFKKLLDLMAPEKKTMMEERNFQYKNLLLEMRTDILMKTSLSEDDLDIRGNKK